MIFLVIVLCCTGVFFAGMFVMTQYSIDLIEWIQSNKDDKHIFFIDSSAIIKFRVLWGIASAVGFIIGLYVLILVV